MYFSFFLNAELIRPHDQWEDDHIQEGPSAESPGGDALTRAQEAPEWRLAVMTRVKGHSRTEALPEWKHNRSL